MVRTTIERILKKHHQSILSGDAKVCESITNIPPETNILHIRGMSLGGMEKDALLYLDVTVNLKYIIVEFRVCGNGETGYEKWIEKMENKYNIPIAVTFTECECNKNGFFNTKRDVLYSNRDDDYISEDLVLKYGIYNVYRMGPGRAAVLM